MLGLDLSGSTDILGLDIASIDLPQPFDPNLNAMSPCLDPSQSAPGFLVLMQDDSIGDSTPGATLQRAPTPAITLVRADGRPTVPLPRTPRVASPAQMSPHVATSHGSPESHSSTPMLTAAFLAQDRRNSTSGDAPLPSSSIGVGADPSRLFSRSYSAPLATPRRSSLHLSASATRPVTPVAPTADSTGAVFSPPHSPALLGTPISVNAPSITSQPDEVGIPDAVGPDEPLLPFPDDDPEIDNNIGSHRWPDSPVYVSSEAVASHHNGLLVAAPGLPPMKRTRLRSPASFAPTAKEIGEYKRREYRAIQKKRKYNMPQGKKGDKANKAGPRVGVNMGSFTHQKQEYISVMRASMTFDLIGYSPWNESEMDMRVRAIALADEGTGLKGEDFVSGDFEVTVWAYY